MLGAIRIATVTAASLALLVGGVAAASADSTTINDKHQDVVLNGKVGSDRTAPQRGFAKALDVRSVKFAHGSKYVSVKIGFDNIKRGADYRATVTFAGRSAGRAGKIVLFGSIGTNVRDAYTADNQIGSVVCGPGAVPQIKTTTVKYGKNGYFFVQMPRECAGGGPSLKANVQVAAGGFRASPESAGAYVDYVSSTKYKTPKWTEYVEVD